MAKFSTAAAAAESLQWCLTLCDPIDGSPPGSPIPRILQARTLEWVAISFSNVWKWKVKVKSLSHVLTLCDPMDCSPAGSSIHGIFQDFTGVGCHCLLWHTCIMGCYTCVLWAKFKKYVNNKNDAWYDDANLGQKWAKNSEKVSKIYSLKICFAPLRKLQTWKGYIE